MTHVVSWEIIVLDADDEVDAVRRAQEMLATGKFNSYGVRDLDASTYCVVDMTTGTPEIITIHDRIFDA